MGHAEAMVVMRTALITGSACRLVRVHSLNSFIRLAGPMCRTRLICLSWTTGVIHALGFMTEFFR